MSTTLQARESEQAAVAARSPRGRFERRRARRTAAEPRPRTIVSPLALRRRRNRVLYWAALSFTAALFALVFFFPLYWMITGAMKSPAELAQSTPTLWPHSWHPGVYAQAWTNLQIGTFFRNTVVLAAGSWLFQIVFDVSAAYALSKLRPPFGRTILALMLATLMLPTAAVLVPKYLAVVKVPLLGMNLLNTPWAVWLPSVANAFNIFLLKRFFDQLPQELLEAATLDGAGRLRTLRSVVLPISRPVIAVVSIFSIVEAWKDFLWPLLVLPDRERQPLSVGLAQLGTWVPINQMLAGLVITSLPMLVIFLIFQRRILGGLAAGALKG